MGELDRLWSSRYKERNLWRERAKKSYINSIMDEELKEFIEDSMKGTVPVSLYGKSQVGKTTFLLQLMGVKKEYLETIHGILRCGTKEGAPATPTAMIYKRTADEVFRIHYQSNVSVCPTEEAISTELTNLRKSVEDGTYQHLDEIVIEIPDRYFNEHPKINIQICDLPGIDSSNEKERPHVEQIIKKFIPLSALILVFQIGSDINSVSDLFSNGIMSETYGWKCMKNRYRLIITKAFTADSVVQEIKFDDPITGKEDLIGLYRREANRDENKPDNVPDDVKIFPFELGKSLGDLPLKYNGDELRLAVIHSIMEDLWSEIHEDINVTADSGNIVQRLSEIPHILRKVITDKQREKAKVERDFQIIIEERESEITELSINNEISLEKKKETEDEITRLSGIGMISGFSQYEGDKHQDEMLKFIAGVRSGFRERTKRVNEQIPIEKSEQWQNETYELFSWIKGEIEKIKFKKPIFFGRIFGPDQWHIKELNACIRNLNSKISNKYNPTIQGIIATKKTEYENVKRGLKTHIYANNDRIHSLQKEVNDSCSERDTILEALSQKIESFESELRNENSFHNFMLNEVREETTLVMAKLEEKSPVEAFLDLAYSALIIKQYNRQIEFN